MGLPRVVIQRLQEEVRLANILYRLNKLEQKLEKMPEDHSQYSLNIVARDALKEHAQNIANRIKLLLKRETLTSVEIKDKKCCKKKK